MFLTLGAHAPQGYSSLVCVCVRLPFFHTVTNWPRRPMDRISAANDKFKTCFCETPFLQSYRIRVIATRAAVRHFVCP